MSFDYGARDKLSTYFHLNNSEENSSTNVYITAPFQNLQVKILNPKR